MPDALSSTHEQGFAPCNLIFGETDYFNCSASVQSLPVPSNILSRGCVMLKIVYPVCCGMDVHKSFVVACIASTNEQGVTSCKSKRFSTFTGDCTGVQSGFLKTIAKMGVWNPPESIGFPSTTFSEKMNLTTRNFTASGDRATWQQRRLLHRLEA